MNKYHARRTVLDGQVFDSAGEARRYRELRLLEQAGVIVGLERQPCYPLVVNGAKVGIYRGDFRYRERGELVVEDFKSPATRTPVYRLKRKLVLALYGIEILETGA